MKEIVDEMMPGIGTNCTTAEILGMITDIGSFNVVQQSLFPFTYVDQERNLTTAYVYCDTLSENVTLLHKFLYGYINYQPSNTVEEVSEYITSYRKEHP